MPFDDHSVLLSAAVTIGVAKGWTVIYSWDWCKSGEFFP